MFNKNIPTKLEQCYTSLLGILHIEDMSKYLGTSFKKRKEAQNMIVEKLEKKLALWKEKLILQTIKGVFIQTALTSSSAYDL